MDDKILTDWNGLMTLRWQKAEGHLMSLEYIEAAKKAAGFIYFLKRCVMQTAGCITATGMARLHYQVSLMIMLFFIWGLIELMRRHLMFPTLNQHWNLIISCLITSGTK